MMAELHFAEGSPPQFHAGRCVNRRHAGARCSRCADACPAQAIVLQSQEPRLDESACVRCGLCLHICPTDVYTPVLDFEKRLGETVANLPLAPMVLVCPAHPAPALTAAKVKVSVQHRRCLAALSQADLLDMSAGGRRPLLLDDSPCVTCAIAGAHVTMQSTVDTARTLLHTAGLPPTILLHSERPLDDAERMVQVALFDGAQPAMSRRSFLSRFRPNPTEQTGQEEETQLEDWLGRGAPVSSRLPQQVPGGRRKLLAALGRLGSAQAGRFSVSQSSFGSVELNANGCSACGLCARFCPTGALRYAEQVGDFELTFQPAACVGCGVCAAACPEDAIMLGKTIHLSTILADEVTSLAAGELTRCSTCGASTAQRDAEPIARCHVCRHGAGPVTALRDGAGLMNDLLRRIPRADGGAAG